MTMRRLAFVSAVLLIAGCGAQASSSTRTATHADVGRPYALYTHCGIEWAKIAGRFWRATRALSDGSGNPPAGWGNPYQQGRLVLLGQRMARFDSSPGSVTFERTSRRQPPVICS
jgi:hypothetical protein